MKLSIELNVSKTMLEGDVCGELSHAVHLALKEVKFVERGQEVTIHGDLGRDCGVLSVIPSEPASEEVLTVGKLIDMLGDEDSTTEVCIMLGGEPREIVSKDVEIIRETTVYITAS